MELSIGLYNLALGPAMTAMTETGGVACRKAAMEVLAHSDSADIAELIATLPLPAYEIIRPQENGLVMIRGRIGGDGAPFCLGEATVSRAAVRLSTGERGFGYALGRDGGKAMQIALCDALIQTADHVDAVQTRVIAPLRARLLAEQNRRAAEAAATRVDFYTLVRGEG